MHLGREAHVRRHLEGADELCTSDLSLGRGHMASLAAGSLHFVDTDCSRYQLCAHSKFVPVDQFKHSEIQGMLNIQEPSQSQSPLHLR